MLTIKRRLPVFKVFLINLRPGVVCYPHLYISHYTPCLSTPRPFLYAMCKGRFVFACPVTLTVRSLKTRKGETSGGLLVLSQFSHSFSKTGYWSLRRRIVSYHVLNTSLSQSYGVYDECLPKIQYYHLRMYISMFSSPKCFIREK